jgi:competence protein ComEA
MDTSRKKLTRIMAVVGIGLFACAAKLWLDTTASPAVIYTNSDTSEEAGSLSAAPVSICPAITGEPEIVPETLPTCVPTTEEIPVYICGAVSNPGIYQILPGSYLYQVIDIAGGLLPEAAAEYINLVFSFSEAVSIYIPSKEEMKAFLAGTSTSSSAYLRNGLIQGIWGNSNSAGASSGNSPASEEAVLVNINTADQKQLETLPGVGETTAKAIISYREKSGGFTKIEDIMNVAGIKEGRFEAIREFITV